ncbi:MULTISPECIES: hypothetical protein [unclassified Campylobacter]|nr:hypothetical protein [Campylobacter sp. RM12651]MBZ7976412.1 hypothetical protein [Campylobacter sp. RM12637]MBZ7984631.1 hypothetical protein [Campylobacter sp. RM12647]ULO02656.1 hypothetical protein AVBRAN_0170 [Campylobacter sp. RM12651]
MKNYIRAIEILKELETLLDNDSVFLQSEEDRINDEKFIKKVAKDFPNTPYEQIKQEIITLLTTQCNEQYIIYHNKRYLLLTPSLKVITYIFSCINQDKLTNVKKIDFENDETTNFLNICIDIARKCSEEIKYRNDKLRSLLGELGQI